MRGDLIRCLAGNPDSIILNGGSVFRAPDNRLLNRD